MTHLDRKYSAGKMEETTRSDCLVEVEVKSGGGISIQLESKVVSLYGDTIRALVNQVCSALGLKHAAFRIVDQGALPYVLAARIEAAIKRALPNTGAVYLPESAVHARLPRLKQRPRRSRLYLPGNEPKFFPNAGLHKPDAIILDLEDSVPLPEKDAARILVRNALRCVDFYGAERMVRINRGEAGLEDLRSIVAQDPDVILLPKCEDVETIHHVENELVLLERPQEGSAGTLLLPIIESALGVVNAYAIATASPRICALSIGLEDYTADIGVEPTVEAKESQFARSVVVNAARAAHVQALDSVYGDVDDTGGLRRSALEAKALGFEGKGCIHPRQIRIVHEAFAPTAQEIERARKIIQAAEDAGRGGSGVATLDARMVDAPVVIRAERILRLAEQMDPVKGKVRTSHEDGGTPRRKKS